MDDQTLTLQAAAAKMQESAEALDQAYELMHSYQSKHDAAIKKITDLMKQREKTWDATASAALSSYTAKQSLHHRALLKQQNYVERARRAYETHRNSFERLSDLYRDQLTQTRYLRHRQDRRERALARTFERMVHKLYSGPDQREGGFKVPLESHSYIAMDAGQFLNMLMDLDGYLTGDPEYAVASGRYRPVSFLEVGCGQGRNMMLAQNARILMVEDVYGFDIDTNLVEGGKTGLGFGDNIYVADAMEMDYGDFDVVYSYRPFSDLEMQAQLEERISSTMRKGAYYLGSLSYDMARYPEMQRMAPEVEIWKKVAETGTV